jgi:uncharacterized protein YjeT (DUF2065 family)
MRLGGSGLHPSSACLGAGLGLRCFERLNEGSWDTPAVGYFVAVTACPLANRLGCSWLAVAEPLLVFAAAPRLSRPLVRRAGATYSSRPLRRVGAFASVIGEDQRADCGDERYDL